LIGVSLERLVGSTEEERKERIGLLDEEEKDEMERLVVKKMEMETRILQWDPDKYTLAYHQEKRVQKRRKSRGIDPLL
jgi:hypothetical protein